MNQTLPISFVKKFLPNDMPAISGALNILLIFYAALLPISGAFSTHTGPYILLILWLLEGGFSKKFHKIKKEKVFLAFFALFGIYLLSFLWTDNIKEGIHSIKYYFSIAVIMTVYYTSLHKRFIPYVLAAFLGSMFISEVLSYGIFFELWRFGERGVPENPTPFMHHIKYSIFLGVTIFLLLWQILKEDVSYKLKIFEALFLVSATANLFLNGGRTGQIGFILASFVFVISYFGTKLKYIATTFLIVVSIVTSAYFFSPIFQKRVHMGISDVEKIFEGELGSSWGLRVAMKIISFDIIKDHPLLGVGLGDFRNEFVLYLKKTKLKKLGYLHHLPHVHDQFLQTTIQTGLLGLALLLFFLYSLFKKEFDDPLIKSVFLAVLTTIVFSYFTESSLRNNTSALLAFLIGYFWRINEFEIESKTQ